MKRLIHLILVALFLNVSAGLAAQERKPNHREDRKEWMKKLKNLKQEYLIKQLDLTEAQRSEFFRIYDEKENERMAAEQKLRVAERNIRAKADAATDADYDAAIAAQYKLNSELADIEAKYEPQLRKVLTRRQLFNLRGAEHGFQRKLMEHCPNPKNHPNMQKKEHKR